MANANIVKPSKVIEPDEVDTIPDPAPTEPPAGANLLVDRSKVTLTANRAFMARRRQYNVAMAEFFGDIESDDQARDELEEMSLKDKARLGDVQMEYLSDQAENLRRFAKKPEKWDEFLCMGDEDMMNELLPLVQWWGEWGKASNASRS